jgi:hypothetical protein
MFMFYDVMNIIEGLNMISDNKQASFRAFSQFFGKARSFRFTDPIIFITNYQLTLHLNNLFLFFHSFFAIQKWIKRENKCNLRFMRLLLGHL